MAKDFRDLNVWRDAIDMVESVYVLSRRWPSVEQFGLISQCRRAAVSVAANIAEGEGRGSDQDFIRFLWIAHGSLREVETHLTIARRLQFCDEASTARIFDACAQIGRQLHGLIKSLRS